MDEAEEDEVVDEAEGEAADRDPFLTEEGGVPTERWVDEGEARLTDRVVALEKVDEDGRPHHPTKSSIAEARARKTLLKPIYYLHPRESCLVSTIAGFQDWRREKERDTHSMRCFLELVNYCT